ncbi:MAG: sugar phosphorylase [Endozoicomonas sp.]|uniref:sugar phosphorylase n=1 Tax=Endozoicomonas sp. TaxID=1892382 RepID=UPI003D9B9B39
MLAEKISEKVALLYGEERAGAITEDILLLVEKWRGKFPSNQSWVDETTSYLITYGDSIQKEGEPTLKTMKQFADRYLKDAISNIHILPMFPYTSDDGFSVVDYRKVNPELGDWQELNALAEQFDLMYDCVINHISRSSDWFQGFLAGEEKYQNYFVDADPKADYSSVTRPRTLPLLTPFTKADGSEVNVWTTFSEDQVDINFAAPEILLESLDILMMYAANGGRSIRLDAIGFIWKVLNTRCIHLPQAHEIIKLWRLVLDEVAEGTLLMTETNVPHQENISYFGQGDEAHMVYQFPLPPLTLHAFLREDSSTLTKWATDLTREAMAADFRASKTTFFNFLASHDGIGVRPTEGILSDSEREYLVSETFRKSGKVNFKANTDGSQSPYELNINYLSALTEPDDDVATKARKFLAAQSILLSFIGVPAIYYHSLLGSENDMEGMETSGINRRINREKLDIDPLMEELATQGSLKSTIYHEMIRLLGIRQSQKAFSPDSAQKVLDLGKAVFGLQRGEDLESIAFAVNLSGEDQTVALGNDGIDLVSGQGVDREFTLEPYQFIWVKI